jgi:hypothetical protein
MSDNSYNLWSPVYFYGNQIRWNSNNLYPYHPSHSTVKLIVESLQPLLPETTDGRLVHQKLWYSHPPLSRKIRDASNKIIAKYLLKSDLSSHLHNLERPTRLIPLKGEFLGAEARGLPFRFPQNFTSQPSTFLGTQTSKRNCPRTLWALMLGKLGTQIGSSFCSSRGIPDSLSLLLCPAELGKKKWSLGPTATLLKLSFELIATFCRSQINSDISSCVPSIPVLSRSSITFREYVDTAFSNNWLTAALYWIGWCL